MRPFNCEKHIRYANGRESLRWNLKAFWRAGKKCIVCYCCPTFNISRCEFTFPAVSAGYNVYMCVWCVRHMITCVCTRESLYVYTQTHNQWTFNRFEGSPYFNWLLTWTFINYYTHILWYLSLSVVCQCNHSKLFFTCCIPVREHNIPYAWLSFNETIIQTITHFMLTRLPIYHKRGKTWWDKLWGFSWFPRELQKFSCEYLGTVIY